MIDTTLFWNVQALGGSRKQLKSLVRKNQVAAVAILEPFQEEAKMSRLSTFMGFTKFCCNESSGAKV